MELHTASTDAFNEFNETTNGTRITLTAHLKETGKQTISGTITTVPAANTRHFHGDDGRSYELMKVQSKNVILIGIDGREKTADAEPTETGYNKHGKKITTEHSPTWRFDGYVTELSRDNDQTMHL